MSRKYHDRSDEPARDKSGDQSGDRDGPPSDALPDPDDSTDESADTADSEDEDTAPAQSPQENPVVARTFERIREALDQERTKSLGEVAEDAGLPTEILREVFAASDRTDHDRYNERDLAYARDVRKLLDFYPLETVVRSARVRRRAITSMVVNDLTAVRDRVVNPALEQGMDVEQLAEMLGRTAAEVVPIVTRTLEHDYYEVLLQLLDTEAVAAGMVTTGNEVELAVGFVDLVGYTDLSASVDPNGLGEVLTEFEDLVVEAVKRQGDVLLPKFIGDAAMLVSQDVTSLARAMLDIVSGTRRLSDAPRRGGMAFGPILVREGDYFGGPTNLAARLTDQARPATLLADEALTDALKDDFQVDDIGKTKLRGIGERRPIRVRHPDDN